MQTGSGDKILKKSLVRDTIYYLLASLIPAFLLVLINPLLAQRLSPYDYAIIGYISSFAAIVTPIVTFMLMRYYFVTYFKVTEEKRAEIKTAILHSLILVSLALSFIVVSLISIYHYIFNSDSEISLFPYLILLVSAIWFGAIYTFQLSEFKIQRQSGKYLLYSSINAILKVALLILLVVIARKGALGYELASALTALILFIVLLFKYKYFIFRKINFSLIADALKFCWPLVIAGCLEFFSNGIGGVILERQGNTEEYGFYMVGNQFSLYVGLATAALFSTFNPDIYESASNGNRRKLLKILAILFLVEVLLVFLFELFAPYIIDILTAGRYLSSVPYAKVLVISNIFVMVFYYMNDITIALGYSKIMMWTKLFAGIIAIIVLSTLIGKYQYFGAAWGQSLIYVIYILVNLVFLKIAITKSR